MESRDIPGIALPSWRRDWVFGLLLVAVTLIAYLPLWHAGFIWDDDAFVTDNPIIKKPDGLYRVWFTAATPDYYPLTFSMLWVEWRLWGNNPLGYHLVNVLLHAVSAVLLWRALLRLKIPGALLAAAIFALHPVNVESAAWISEGKNTVAMLFFMTTLLAWLEFEDGGGGRCYWLAFLSFALALFGKTAAAPLPVVLLGIAWWRRGRVEWKDVWRTIPFFAISGAISCVTVWFHYHRAIGSEIVRSDNFWSRLAGAGWAVWFYLYKAVLPLRLAFVYPRWHINADSAWSYIPLLLLVAVFVICWRRAKPVFFALAYFVVMLLPVLGFLNIFYMRYSLVADHWQYFAIIGPIALAGALIRKPVVAAVVLLALGALTWRQCEIYANLQTLWQATIQANPSCWMAENNLGSELLENGNAAGSMDHFQKALQLKPDFAEAQNNLGMALAAEGKTNEARSHYEEALRLDSNYDAPHVMLGLLLANEKKFGEAAAHYQAALKINPDSAPAQNDLGAALMNEGQWQNAIPHFEQALRLDPALARAQHNLAIAYFQKGLDLEHAGQIPEAVGEYAAALRLNPDFPEALQHSAWIAATDARPQLRNGAEAMKMAARACQLTGDNRPSMLLTLAAADAEMGRYKEALTTIDQAEKVARAEGAAGFDATARPLRAAFAAGRPFHGQSK
jgi:tetratricopeptide (TPR) repeat protein